MVAGNRISIKAQQVPGILIRVPGDPSAAAFLVAGPSFGAAIKIKDVGMLNRRGIVDLLMRWALIFKSEPPFLGKKRWLTCWLKAPFERNHRRRRGHSRS